MTESGASQAGAAQVRHVCGECRRPFPLKCVACVQGQHSLCPGGQCECIHAEAGAGAAAPDVEHTKVYNTKVDDLGVPMAAPDVERLIADLRTHVDGCFRCEMRCICEEAKDLMKSAADALSAAHTREAEREAIFEAVVDALEGRNVSDFMESFPAVRLALDARAREADLWAKYENVCRLYQVTSEREAALRAENERLTASISEQVKAAYDMGMASNRERAESAEAHVARLEAALSAPDVGRLIKLARGIAERLSLSGYRALPCRKCSRDGTVGVHATYDALTRLADALSAAHTREAEALKRIRSMAKQIRVLEAALAASSPEQT